MMTTPKLTWDLGTAYDLFLSLEVLHRPGDFELRGSWAAGIRARLPTAAREILEQAQRLFHLPMHWIYTLPEPKDAATALWILGQTPPAERLPVLALAPEAVSEVAETLRGVAARGTWEEADAAVLIDAHQQKWGTRSARTKATNILKWWARAEEFGERYLEALQTYQEAFFAEEEKRIRPTLQDALDHARQLADRLELPDLLEELSQGLRLAEPPEVAEVVLVPSYWNTPLVYYGRVDDDRYMWVFGARPADASLVPGQAVPDAMLRALRALSDPTRLRILSYVSEKPLYAAQLTRLLRLRAPTVTHHLKILRLAGLVQLTLGEEKGKERYATRREAINNLFQSLKEFLGYR